MNRWVRARRTLSLTAAMVVAGLWAGDGHAQAQRPVAHGLIVKLKEGASAQALRSEDAAAQGRERLQRVMNDAGLRDAATVRTRPAGRTAQHLDFGRLLASDEAERLMAQLRARPDVEWVEPNSRERRLAVPNDPGFAPGFLPGSGVGSRVPQWWMYPVGGFSSDPIESRRRGVPGFQDAWNLTTGLASAPVAVLDTGIIAGHPELSGKVLPGYDFVSDAAYANDGHGRDADPTDPGDWVSQEDKEGDPLRYGNCLVENSSWHGTDIAGLIAATTNDGRGTAGINWNAQIVPVRVAGKCGAFRLDIVEGMRWAAGIAVPGVPFNNPNPVRVINISFGGSDPCARLYQDVINELKDLGVVVVAAAGNEQGAVTAPAVCPSVVGVGAVNRDGFKANYSNFGAGLAITTVGGDPQRKLDGSCDGRWGCLLGDDGILGLDIAGTREATGYGYATLFGTSFSTPIVAGAVSLMLSVNPALTHQQIVEGLRLSARRHVTSTQMQACSASNIGRCICTTATCGAGLLDAEQALIYAQSPTTYAAPNWPVVSIDSADIAAALQLGADEPDADDVGGGGGGALQPAWLLALALFTLLLACAPRARRAARRIRR
jgi:serine protease